MIEKCCICGNPYNENQLYNGVCTECIGQHRYDIDLCYNIGEKQTVSININGFLAKIFDAADIEEILREKLDEYNYKCLIDCRKFIIENIEDFKTHRKEGT